MTLSTVGAEARAKRSADEVREAAAPWSKRLGAGSLGVLLALQFAGVVLALRGFDAAGTGLTANGQALVLHHVLRVVLVFNLLILCYSAGYRVLLSARIDPATLFKSATDLYVGCFFFGASLYGIGVSVLGLAGVLNVWASLAVAIPAMLAAVQPLGVLSGLIRFSIPLLERRPLGYAESAFVLLSILGLSVFLLVTVVFIAVYDPNVWEHYLHYYRTVLATGSTQPNEVWHHFYATKGAGLILMTNALSDCFGAPVASAAFVVTAAVVVFSLIRGHIHSRSWALFGVALFFGYMAARGFEEAAMYKHHGALLGYASFLLWGCVRLRDANKTDIRPLTVILAVSMAYLGFYLPVTAVVFCLSLVLAVLGNAILKRELCLPPILAMVVALSIGAATDFLLNWRLTGLVEVTPMRLLWELADQNRAQEVFGKGGIEFFLRMNNDLSRQYDWSFQRAFDVLRNPLPNPKLSILILLAGGLVLLRARIQGRSEQADLLSMLAYVAALLLPLMVFGVGVQTAAVDRMGLYSVPGVVVALVVLAETAIRFSRSEILSPIANGRFGAILHNRVAYGLALLLIAVFTTYVARGVLRPIKGWDEILDFAKGQASLLEVFQRMETRWYPTSMDISLMSDFRKSIPAGDRVLRLTYDTGYAYALPGEGLVSEPTYSVVDDPDKMLDRSPEQVSAYLAQRGIRYLTLNLNGRLFSTVAFSQLLSPDTVDKYLSVEHQAAGFFILKLKDASDSAPFPAYLKVVLDLKRSGALHNPFSQEFRRVLTSIYPLAPAASRNDSTVRPMRAKVLRDADQFERAKSEFLADMDKLNESALRGVTLEESRMVLRRMFKQAGDALSSELVPRLSDGNELTKRLSPGLAPLATPMFEADFRDAALTMFRHALLAACIAEFGSPIAHLFSTCDERVPFGKYPNNASCG